MKKLLLLLFLGSATFAEAQVLQTEDFNGLTLGEVGTDITGVTAGQDNWLTFSSNGAAPTTATNAANSNFEIVATGFDGTNGLKIVGSDGNKGSRFMWKPDFTTLWDTRDAGNEIIEIEYDLFTGAASTSTAQYGVRLYGLDGATSRVLNGFIYNINTRELEGVAYLNNAGTFGTYLVNLAAAPGLILNENTWYRIGFAYDTSTGEMIWNPGTGSTGLPAANWTGPFALDEIDFVSGTPTTNTGVSEIVFDNLTVKATATEGLLGVTEIADATFGVTPNPARDFVTITTNDTLKSVELFDMNGRTVLVSEGVNQINVSDLASGIYMMKVTSDKGTATKKLIVE
jgi:Secretion system C-terminal sorting domain